MIYKVKAKGTGVGKLAWVDGGRAHLLGLVTGGNAMTNLRVLIAAATFAAVTVVSPYARAEDKSIVVASTTSTLLSS
jgi:hypothetical protein